MDEQSKAARRRLTDWRYSNRWMVGRLIDVGCGPDPVKMTDFPLLTEVVPFDQEFGDGRAEFLTDIPDQSFDCLHSSHCLEHLKHPLAALRNWGRILKPGGFMIVTVPEELLYEGGRWPSRYNADHKSSFTLRSHPVIPTSTSVLWLLFKLGLDVEHVTLLTEHWTVDKLIEDQTLGPAECAIEFVARRADLQKPW